MGDVRHTNKKVPLFSFCPFRLPFLALSLSLAFLGTHFIQFACGTAAKGGGSEREGIVVRGLTAAARPWPCFVRVFSFLSFPSPAPRLPPLLAFYRPPPSDDHTWEIRHCLEGLRRASDSA